MRSKEVREELATLWQCQGGRSENEAALKFDSETLGGRVTYPELIGPVRKLKVGLEGVTIRYGPSLLTSDGPAGRTVAKRIPLDTVSFFFLFFCLGRCLYRMIQHARVVVFISRACETLYGAGDQKS